MTLSTIQEFPNRVNESGNKAVVGSTTGVDANDPVVPSHSGTHYVYIDGSTGNYLQTPDESALDVTGDIDIRAHIAVSDYVGGGIQSLVSKRLGGQHSYQLRIDNSGQLELLWSEDLSATQTATCDTALTTTDGDEVHVRATMDVDNGAANSDITFYTSSDGTTWATIGSVENSGATTSIAAGTADLYVGQRGTGADYLAGCVFRAMVLDGIDGTTVLDINPAVDIDTSSDPDAGQTSFTATTGQTVTVNRATSGLTTAIVTRPVALLDGSAFYLQLPAEDTPTFTATAGKHTVVTAFRAHVASANQALWSSESASNNGAILFITSADKVIARGGDGGSSRSSTSTVSVTDGTLRVAAAVYDNGTVKVYVHGEGFAASNDYSALTGLTHAATTRWGSRAYGVTLLGNYETFEHLTFHNQALTEDQLDALAATLISGDYT